MTESNNREYKQLWKDEFLKVICAFANADGGLLEIGRRDDGTVMGVSNVARLMEDLPNKIRDVLGIVTDVNLREEELGTLIQIITEPHPNPISYKGEYYYRSGSTVQALKGGALERFLLRKRGRHWDGIPLPGFNRTDCSSASFDRFRQRAAKSGRMDDSILHDSDDALLENLQLVEGDYLRQAGALLFAKDPDRFITGAYVKIGFFVTDDNLRYQDEIHGNLFEQIEKTINLLKTKYMKAYIRYEELQRVEEFLFPLSALREALLNALAHKDYGAAIPIQISVYDDHIVLWNAGVLPEKWTVESLLEKHPSRPFNPLIANTLFRAGYIESWGRGIEKIAAECKKHGIAAPDYNYQMSGLMLTFHANLPADAEDAALTPATEGEQNLKPSAGILDATQETTQETTQEKILRLIRETPTVTRRELALIIGLTEDGIKYHLVKLKKEGVLQHVGSTKSGHWEVLK